MGILQDGMPVQPGSAPAPTPGSAPAPTPGSAPAPGQPQAAGGEDQLNQAMQLASQALYDKNVFDGLANAYAGDPAGALSNTAVTIVMKVEERLGPLSLDNLFALLIIVIGDASDALEQSGEEVNADVITDSLEAAIQLFLMQHPNRFSEEELRQGVAELEQALAAAPQEGV